MAERRDVATNREECFNNVQVGGILESNFEYSHNFACENFYKNRVRVARLSGTEDFVPIVVSEMMIKDINTQVLKGKRVELEGQFRSHTKPIENGKNVLELFVFVSSIKVDDEATGEPDPNRDYNKVFLEGYICKPTVYRVTPFGREITEVKIAVNRGYGKCSYIPCITWGRIAQNAVKLQLGDKIKLEGRFQSREYVKRFPDSKKEETRMAYEVSISSCSKINV